MAENSLYTVTEKNELGALQETLFSQQQLIQNLYFELEKEREASATAASEALSMILRLQGERAAEKMEAHQYKRMAEEKILHVEDSLGALEELVYQKEMEIDSLEFQVQAYKRKLLSAGFAGLEIRESESPQNISFCNNDTDFEMMKCCGATKRDTCMHIGLSKEPCLRKSYVERSPFSLRQKNKGESECVESTSENCNSHWKRIEKIDERVKELIHAKSNNEEIETECFRRHKELQSAVAVHPGSLRGGLQFDSWNLAASPMYSENGASACLNSEAEGVEKTGMVDNRCDLVKIQDVFEIPQKQMEQDPTPKGENRFEKPDSVDDYLEALLVNKTLLTAYQESIQKALTFANQNNKLLAQQFVDLKNDVNRYKAEFEQINKRFLVLEDEKRSMRQEAEDRRKEEMELQGNICQEIKEIRSHLKTANAEKRTGKDDSRMASFMEAMLSFSI